MGGARLKKLNSPLTAMLFTLQDRVLLDQDRDTRRQPRCSDAEETRLSSHVRALRNRFTHSRAGIRPPMAAELAFSKKMKVLVLKGLASSVVEAANMRILSKVYGSIKSP
jgi:hypothetical protein